MKNEEGKEREPHLEFFKKPQDEYFTFLNTLLVEVCEMCVNSEVRLILENAPALEKFLE
jgi:hypothetical protein